MWVVFHTRKALYKNQLLILSLLLLWTWTWISDLGVFFAGRVDTAIARSGSLIQGRNFASQTEEQLWTERPRPWGGVKHSGCCQHGIGKHTWQRSWICALKPLKQYWWIWMNFYQYFEKCSILTPDMLNINVEVFNMLYYYNLCSYVT